MKEIFIVSKKDDSKKSDNFKFYCKNDSDKPPKEHAFSNFVENNFKNIEYPCCILIRENNWNDYSYYTHFFILLLPKNGEIIHLGTTRIIQSNVGDLCTTLPSSFDTLPKKEFFSRGIHYFYIQLKKYPQFKDTILASLNDIHYHNYTREYINKIGGIALTSAYDSSLYREDFYVEVTSEYAQYSLEMLDKIGGCVDALSKLDEDKQKVIIKLLYGSVITSLETYLGDAFKYHVINNQNYYSSFLKNYDFDKYNKKYNLKELGLQGNRIGDYIKDKVKSVMNDISFHNLELVESLFEQILNIKLPSNWTDFKDSIQKRHDIFHRNGKNIAGTDLDIKPYEVVSLISKVKKFIGETQIAIDART